MALKRKDNRSSLDKAFDELKGKKYEETAETIIEMEPVNKDNFDVRISVSQELRDHYTKVVNKRDEILDHPLSEDKAVTGILNATTSIIRELGKIQEELYNSEKFAVFQQAVISTIQDQEPEVAEKIVERLGALDFT